MTPRGWKLCRVSEFVSDCEAGISFECEDFPAKVGQPGVLKLSCFRDGRFDPNENKAVPPNAGQRLKTSLRKGDLLFSRSNSPELVGAAVIVDADYPNLFLPDKIWKISVASGSPDSRRWFGQLIASPNFQRRLQSIASGTSGSMKNISQAAFGHLEFLLPPPAEQRKIAEILGEWDTALDALDRLIAAKARRHRDTARRLLLNKQSAPKWKSVRIGELLQDVDRYVDWDDLHEYRLASIRRRSGGLFYRETLRGSQIKVKTLKHLRPGDFVISRMQVVHGAMSLALPKHDGLLVSDSYTTLVARDPAAFDMRFLDHLSRQPEFYRLVYVCSYGVHIEKMTFVLEDFLHEKIRIPASLAEQRRIADLLDAADAELRLLRKQRDALADQKRGLMQLLLTGKKRIRV